MLRYCLTVSFKLDSVCYSFVVYLLEGGGRKLNENKLLTQKKNRLGCQIVAVNNDNNNKA